MRRILLSVCALFAAGCLSPVGEVECVHNADCADGGVCVDATCSYGTGGGSSAGGGSATGGGSNAGGGSNTGGGSSAGGGSTTGGGSNAGGGSTTGGGSNAGGGSNVGGGGPLGGGSTVGGGGGTTCGCMALGMCQPGNSALACGLTGGACVTCGLGEQCVSGACVQAACGPQSCDGCCTNNFCIVSTQQNRFACGAQGAACTQCGMGLTCTNGACTPPPVCDATTCPTGCCQNGQCVPGNNRMACGGGGQACQRCTGMSMCQSQVCTGGTVSDGGTFMGSTGDACTGSSDCSSGICVPESLGGQPSGYSGGYCTAQCSAAQGCTGGAVCVTDTFFGQAQTTCRAACTTPGIQGSCRTGYVCQSNGTTIGGYCRPRCDNGGLLSACSNNQVCDMQTGVCQ